MLTLRVTQSPHRRTHLGQYQVSSATLVSYIYIYINDVYIYSKYTSQYNYVTFHCEQE